MTTVTVGDTEIEFPDSMTDDEIKRVLRQKFPPQQPPSPTRSAAAGLQRGLAGVAGLPVDTVANVMDLGRAAVGFGAGAIGRPDLAPEIPERQNIVGSGEWIARKLAATGAQMQPQTDSPTDRYAFAAGTGGVSALMTRNPQAMIPAGVRGMAGSTAGTATMDVSGNPALATTVGLAASGAPELAKGGARYAIRGGEQGRERMVQNVESFRRAGAEPSLGQATESRTWRAVESVLSKFPGGAGVMAQKAEAQQSGLGGRMDTLASGLSPRSEPTFAGSQISRGVTERFIPGVKAKQAQLYGDLDAAIPAQSQVPITNTLSTFGRISAGIPGAPAVSQARLVKNPILDELYQAMLADAPNGALPYEAIKGIRTRIGEKLSEVDLSPDVSRQQLKQAYGALSEDMRAAATAAGPKALAAFNRANNYTRAAHGRIESLERVIDKAGGPEKVYLAATSGTGDGATTFRTVMKSLPPDGKAALASAVVKRLGRATPGQQNEAGDQFSTQTFLTNWSRLSLPARETLVAPFGPEFSRNMRAFASVAGNLRQGSKVFQNPSGTSTGAAAIGTAAGIGSALATGNIGGAATIAGGVAAANTMARLMNNQAFIRNLAAVTEIPPEILLAQMSALASGSNNSDQ